MFVEFHKHIPSRSAWMEFCYLGQPLLHLCGNLIHSCRGVQLEDSLGPLGFALTLYPIIKAIVPGLALNAWHLDDGNLVGHREDFTTALHTSLNRMVLWSVSSLTEGSHFSEEADASKSPLPPEIRNGPFLLSSPVSPTSFCEEVFQERFNKVSSSLSALINPWRACAARVTIVRVSVC